MINIKRLFFVFTIFACFFSSQVYFSQKINQFDENNLRTGIWIKNYPNNNIRYSGQFENGKEVGVFKFFGESNSNQPLIIKTYFKEKKEVLVEFYTVKGKLQSKGYFLDKNRIGQWIFYFADGKTMSEEFYKNGKLEGKLVNFYPNGKETEITFYKDGLKDGLSKKYSSNGILIEEITFKKGKQNGPAKYFELNGNLKEAGSYLDGKRVGEWEYYMNGEVAEKKDIENKKSTYTKKKEN